MKHLIEIYANNPALLKRYLEINNINFIGVTRDFNNRWCVYEMWTDRWGIQVEPFWRKSDALELANRLAEIANLPAKYLK